MMNTKNQEICLWSGYAFLFVFLVGFVLVARFVPPPAPGLDAEQIATLFRDNRLNILLGMSICIVACGLFLPWTVAIFCQMIRIETGRVAALSYVQLISGALSATFFLISPLFWLAMAYRAEYIADGLWFINDFAWLAWLVTWPFFFVQNMSIGICALMYKNTVFPRWMAYLSIWSAISMIPISAIAFVTSGPFAWNGLFGFYLPVGMYALWYNALFIVLRKAIKNEQAECAAAGQ